MPPSIYMSKNSGIFAGMAKKLRIKRLVARNSTIDVVVPEDVKRGHVPVIAVDDYQKRKFMVPVSYLKRDSLVRLFERAAEEYGFNYDGVVVIPCRPTELERILTQQDQKMQF